MASPAIGNWAYAVPLNETNGHAAPPPQSHASAAQDPIPRRRTPSAHRRPSDYGIQSDSETVNARKMSKRASSASASRKRSKHGLRESLPDTTNREENVDDSAWIHRDKLAQIEIQEMEEAGIHVRQSRRSGSAGGEGGAKGRSSRSQSRSRKIASREAQDEQMEELNGQYASFDDYRRKRVSTIPAADDLEREEEEMNGGSGYASPLMDNELRTPEEVASEQLQQQQMLQQQKVIRPSTSRIPISKISTVPVPQQVVERDSPLGRSRHGSGGWHENWDEGQYARRARGDSIGSQVLLDDYENGAQDENSSPPKARLPGKNTLTGRKTSQTQSNSRPTSSHLANGSVKNRTPSTPATSQRPVSRSGPGHKSRPSTSHAHPPEGEAPWIASMYKPDPRLPPDQQMLPTHAKRLQQEQWEKEGRVGTAYDRDFRVVGQQELPEPVQQPLHERLQQRQTGGDGLGIGGGNGRGGLSPAIPGSAQHFDQPSPVSALSHTNSPERPWPLSPTKSDDARSVTGSLRPGTSGRYKITPTITDPPANLQRASAATTVGGAGSVQGGAQAHNATPRVPSYDEKEVVSGSGPEGKEMKSRGCGCCVVM